jgi:hypothetical protein
MTTLSNKPDSGKLGAIASAFPQRAIVIHHAGEAQKTPIYVLMCLVLAFIFYQIAHDTLPSLVSDVGMAGAGKSQLDPAASATGSCKRIKWLLIECHATISYAISPQASYKVEKNFSFVSADYDNTVQVLRSTRDWKQATTTLAMDQLGNRLVTAGAMFLLLLGTLGAFGWRGWLVFQRNKLENNTWIVHPVLATIDSGESATKLTFHAEVDGMLRKGVHDQRRDDTPFALGAGQVLALLVVETGHLILLDQCLTTLGLTDEERMRIRAAAA